MVHKLATAANNSPADASHLIFLMEHPNRAAARRCAGLAGAQLSGWTEFYCKRGDVHQKKGTSAIRIYFTRTGFRSSSLWAIRRMKLRICG
jgi:hypothetical protein